MRTFLVSAFLVGLTVAPVLEAQSAPQSSVLPNSPTATADEDPFVSMLSMLSQSDEQRSNENRLSYGFQFTEMYDSNPLDLLSRPPADEIGSINGNAGLSKKWKHASIAGSYNGGADYYYRLKRQDQGYHEASAAQTFMFGPVTFLLGGDYELLPSSSFGFDATHQISYGSIDLINPDLLPSQSIQTPPLQRTSYTGVSQLGLQLGDRSQLSFSGSYGRLRYDKNGIPGTNQASAGAGYSFAVSSRDSIGFAYQYSLYETSGNPLQIVDQVATASYGHRFGKNFTVKFGAGPDLRMYNNTKARLLQGVDTAIAANAALDYSRRSTHLNLTYTRSTTSGQGILQGSDSDQIQLSASQGIGRGWAIGGSAGYARSTSLARVVQSSGTQLVDQLFNSGFYSENLSKKLGSMFTLAFGYTLQTQDSTAPVCSAGLCQNYPLHHVTTVTLAFAPEPIRLK